MDKEEKQWRECVIADFKIIHKRINALAFMMALVTGIFTIEIAIFLFRK